MRATAAPRASPLSATILIRWSELSGLLSEASHTNGLAVTTGNEESLVRPVPGLLFDATAFEG